MFAKILPLACLVLVSCNQSFAQTSTLERVEEAQYSSDIVRFSSECEKWDGWDKPAKPFQIHANTYYVGTCGIAAILILGEDRHALIDSGTEAGADVVLANIRALGIDPTQISVLLNSHEHFDHVGGMAKIQAITDAPVISSPIGIEVMISGQDNPQDPQVGMHDPMQPISHGMPYDWGEAPYWLDHFGLRPIDTPGHTPGALTWQWESCEGDDCKTIVYADSLSPVSSDDYKFSNHPDYVAAYRAGLGRLEALDCDILLTPHPSHSRMIERAATGSFVGGISCAEYAASKVRDLDARLAREAGGEP